MSQEAPHQKPKTCPVCSEATDAAYKPFCSRRCADVDLGRWFSGSYAIAGRADDDATQDAFRSPIDEVDKG